MPIFTDQLGRILNVPLPPQRIVSLVPSQTELLVHLGLEAQLVGITKFCVHPAHLRTTKTIVGGTKQIHFDRIKQLQPDIILCNKEENTQDIVREAHTIAPVHVSDIRTITHTQTLIDQYGDLFEKRAEAQALNGQITTRLKQFRIQIKARPRYKVAYCIWKDPWMVAGNDTFINGLLEWNQLKNAFANHFGRYPEVELQDFKDVDYILLSSEPYPFTEKHIAEIQEHTHAKVLLVDGEYFSWYGSRLVKAFDYFKNLQEELHI